MVADQSESLLAGLGGLLAPVFAPLGSGDWRVSCALVCGLIAKESVISTLTVLLGATSAGALSGLFSPLTAYVFLAFTLLYPPCVAAISTVKSELGGRYARRRLRAAGVRGLGRSHLVHAAGLALGLA